MSNLTPKPIVDKNGKATTVHVKDGNDATPSRVSNVPTAPPVVEEEWVYTPPETATYDQMKERAAAMHPDAKLSLEYGKWVITIETELEEPHELPERFRDTPAWDKYNQLESGENGLYRWIRKGGEGSDSFPLEVNAEYYNLAAEKHILLRQWYDTKMKEVGGRSWEKILQLPSGTATVVEKEVINDWRSGEGEAAKFVNETLAPRYQALWDAGF